MRHTNTKSASHLFVVATDTPPQSVLVLFLRLRNNHSKFPTFPATLHCVIRITVRASYSCVGAEFPAGEQDVGFITVN